MIFKFCFFNQKNWRKGFVTFPFLLVSVIILFLILSFFKLSFTLVHASVAQYIAYSTSRKLALGAINDANTTKQIVKLHSENLITGFFRRPENDMFTIRFDEQHIGSQAANRPFPSPNNILQKDLFYGAGIVFNTKNMLKFKIPYLINDQQQPPSNEHIITSFLGREISQAECKAFFNTRHTLIHQKVNGRIPPEGLRHMEREPDNGC